MIVNKFSNGKFLGAVDMHVPTVDGRTVQEQIAALPPDFKEPVTILYRRTEGGENKPLDYRKLAEDMLKVFDHIHPNATKEERDEEIRAIGLVTGVHDLEGGTEEK
jgi:hypothetical protein